MTAGTGAPDAERQRLLQAIRSGRGATDALAAEVSAFLLRAWPQGQSLDDIARDELLLSLLQMFPIFPDTLERAMTRWRTVLLFANPREELAPLAGALAIQGLLNEYAWAEDAVETERADSLAANLANLTPHEVLLLACYRPLARIAGADELLSRGWEGPVRQVLYEHVAAVRAEANIAATLPSLTPVRSEGSLAVQSQYEDNPYPRWRRPGIGGMLTEVQGRVLPASPLMLIAGCGTGRQAVQATAMIAGSRTMAVDLSRTSLAYAVRKTREIGLQERISYAQADIAELDGAPQFDIVQSAGVLHHMSDPFEGARRICRLAKPGGLIAIGLYSRIARRHLEPPKALARNYTPQTVRELRQEILNRPADDPVRQPMILSPDFYSQSGCRDLIMHVQEHQMTIADLRRMLDENNLNFLGFLQFGIAHIREAYQARFPNDPNGLDLDAWEAFEADNPRTFARMYQFWAEKRA